MNDDLCAWCAEPMREGEPLAPVHGATEHWECFMRSLVGGLNHQAGNCTCCGGDDPPDPPNMTRRQAALAAVGYFYARRNLDDNAR